MDPRRFYVITTTGEAGPFTHEELREALNQGVIDRQHQVRTGQGTMLGTVSSQLSSVSQRRTRTGIDSGQRRDRQFHRFSLLVLAITLLVAGAIALSLRSGTAVTIAMPMAQVDSPRPAALGSPEQATPRSAVSAPSAQTVLPAEAPTPPTLPPPTVSMAAQAHSLHRDLMVWDGAERGGGWRVPGPPNLVPFRDADERHHGHAVVHCHGDGGNVVTFGWNWIGWFPADGGTDLTGMRTLIFAIRIVSDPVVDSVRVALSSSTKKASSNMVDILQLAPTVRNGAWHDVDVLLTSLIDGSAFDAHKAWDIKILTSFHGARTVDIYLDEIGFAR
jgi:hypothetical protein